MNNGNVITELEYLKRIARETARMAYPGRFNLTAGTRHAVIKHFTETLPPLLQQMGANFAYDAWHSDRVGELAEVITPCRQFNPDNPFALSAKLVNTFMHQLMKYERFRYLYNKLHLPLDNSAFTSIRRITDGQPELQTLRDLVAPCIEHSYRFGENHYTQIQDELWRLVKYLNEHVLTNNCQIASRIDLNSLLW